MTNEQIQVQVISKVPAYAKIFGILALIFAILSLIVPVIGTLFITPLAIICTFISLWGGEKGTGIASLVIIVINLVISPTFWANFYAGASQATAGSNRFLTYFDLIGIIALFLALIIGGKKH